MPPPCTPHTPLMARPGPAWPGTCPAWLRASTTRPALRSPHRAVPRPGESRETGGGKRKQINGGKEIAIVRGKGGRGEWGEERKRADPAELKETKRAPPDPAPGPARGAPGAARAACHWLRRPLICIAPSMKGGAAAADGGGALPVCPSRYSPPGPAHSPPAPLP